MRDVHPTEALSRERGNLFRMKRIRVFLFLFIVSSVGVLGGFILSMDYGVRYTSVEPVGDGGVRIEEVRYSGIKDGFKEWELQAGSATYFERDGVTLFDDVRIVFYARNGVSYTLRAKKGRYTERAGRIEVSGDVVIVSDDGYTLNTSALTYLTEKKVVTSDKEVRITSQGMEIEGTGLLIEVEKERFRILKDVKTVLENAVV